MVMSVSTLSRSSSDAFSALRRRRAPSKRERLGDDADGQRAQVAGDLGDDGRRAGAGAAAHAGGDEDHVRVLEGLGDLLRSPPPRPAGRCRGRRPRRGRAVILSPMRILCGASDWRSACASVLTAMNSTPISSARIMRLTALLPPPPTPMTRMRAKFSESDRNGMWDSSRLAGPGAHACAGPPSHGRLGPRDGLVVGRRVYPRPLSAAHPRVDRSVRSAARSHFLAPLVNGAGRPRARLPQGKKRRMTSAYGSSRATGGGS